jgi:hypothetical protein
VASKLAFFSFASVDGGDKKLLLITLSQHEPRLIVFFAYFKPHCEKLWF